MWWKYNCKFPWESSPECKNNKQFTKSQCTTTRIIYIYIYIYIYIMFLHCLSWTGVMDFLWFNNFLLKYQWALRQYVLQDQWDSTKIWYWTFTITYTVPENTEQKLVHTNQNDFTEMIFTKNLNTQFMAQHR
jgi:hypothetical protein